MMEQITWNFSPSVIEQYYGKGQCEKGVLFCGMDDNDRKELGWKEDDKEDKETSTASVAGNTWEDEVLSILKQKNALVSRNGKLPEKEAVEWLKQLSETTENGRPTEVYLYQMQLNVNDQFINSHMNYLNEDYERSNEPNDSQKMVYKKGKLCVQFRNCYPDFVRVSRVKNRWVLSIVDCKLSKRPKLEHKLQACLYAWILEAKLHEWKLSDQFVVDMEKAYIWNKGKAQETEFDLGQAHYFMVKFVEEILPKILKKIYLASDSEEVNRNLCYTMGQKCEWCDNFENCKAWCKKNEPMMLLPYMPRHAQQFLRELSQRPDAEKILQIEGFEDYFSSTEHEDLLRGNIFWKRFLNDKKDAVQMLKKALGKPGEEVPFAQRNTASLEMPTYEKVQLILTAQRDEATDRIYAYGIHVKILKECIDVLELSDALKKLNARNDLVKVFDKMKNDNKQPSKLSYLIVSKTRDKEAFEQTEEEFITLLHGILDYVDTKNRATKQWIDRISLQAYVMDNYEKENIENMLYDVFARRTTIEGQKQVLELLFWLQGDPLVESLEIDARPEEVVSFPVVVLTSVLNRLYIFPSIVANNLCGILEHLKIGFDENGKRYPTYSIIDNPYFRNRLSNVLKNRCINTYWDTQNEDELKKLNEHLQLRLDFESRIIVAIRYTEATRHKNFNQNGVGRIASHFFFKNPSENGNTLLGQLEFEAKYESMLQFARNRAIRGMDIEQAIYEGKVIEAKCVKARPVEVMDHNDNRIVDKHGNQIFNYECEFEVLNSEAVFDESKFTCIFCEKNNENISRVRTLIDIENVVVPSQNCVVKEGCRITMPKMGSFKIVREKGKIKISAEFAAVKKAEMNGEKRIYVVDTKWKQPAEDGKTYLIYDYTNEFNKKKNVDAIRQIPQIANTNTKRFVECLEQIEDFYADTGEKYEEDKVRIEELSLIDGHTFSQSQEKAMQQFYEHNITLLLGPPGTGKTDFISRALVVLYEIYREKNKPFRVLVSANSHSAIENVLFAVEKKRETAEKKRKATKNRLDIYKAERFDDGTISAKGSIDILLDKETMRDLMKDSPDPSEPRTFVVGSTVWTTHKWLSMDGEEGGPENDFDVIVLDEASQVRMVDAIIPFTYSNEKTRFLIVGDENQLSPIILGGYNKEIDYPFRFGSVFRYLGDYSRFYVPEEGKDLLNYQVGLTENFRMNEILVRYSEQKIYRSGYSSFNKAIAEQTVHYEQTPENWLEEKKIKESVNDALKYILDENYPLVLCVVQGKSQVEILEKEIQWIVKITRTLENCLGATSVREFWGSSTEDGQFGIIAPHHAHISRIKNALIASKVEVKFPVPKNWGTEKMEDLYVGTVDKLQGKERQVVLVSYGVGDVEQAIREGEFIYSRNRFNVSLTRGKKKTIVFLTEALLNYPLEALGIDNREISEGIDFLCGFQEFMKNSEVDTKAEQEGFGASKENPDIIVFRKRFVGNIEK